MGDITGLIGQLAIRDIDGTAANNCCAGCDYLCSTDIVHGCQFPRCAGIHLINNNLPHNCCSQAGIHREI
ncbi:MAG: hypothetical protein ACYCX4_13235 [Bacillota bacterium]